MRWLVALALLAGCARPGAPTTPSYHGQDEALARLVADLGPKTGAPSGLVALYRDDDLVSVLSWGPEVLDPRARFELGPVSELVTEVAIRALVAEGKLALDTELGEYLSLVPSAWRVVTIRQLLAHTAGVPDYVAAAGPEIYERPATSAEILGLISAKPLEFEPGARVAPSRTSYYLLSLAAERATDETFEAIMTRTVFLPAEMSNSLTAQAKGQRLMGHRLVDGAVQNVAPLTERSALGAAGLLTTAEDWGRFLARFPRTERLSLGGHTAGFATHVEIAPAQRVSVLVMADLRDAKLDDLIAALTRHLNISTASP